MRPITLESVRPSGAVAAVSILCLIATPGCGGDDDAPTVEHASQVEVDAAADVQEEPPTDDVSEELDAVADSQDAALDAPDVYDGPTGGAALEDYQDACVRLNACLGVVGQGECMRRAFLYEHATAAEQRYYFAVQSLWIVPGVPPGTIYFPDVIGCVAEATTCDEVFGCLGGGSTCDVSSLPSCSDGVLKSCADVGAGQGIAVESNCGEQGLSCFTKPGTGPGICGDLFCSSDSYAGNCVGFEASNCVGTAIVTKPCDALLPGTTCEIAEDYGQVVADCRGDGIECGDTFIPTCDGDNVRVCQGGREYVKTCPAALPCNVDPNSGVASCGALVTAGCAPETCEGAALTYCLDGKPTVVDCGDYGYSGCEENADFLQARCIP